MGHCSILLYIVLGAMAVMKDEGKGNFITFQNVIYPGKARQVFFARNYL